jgi:hypothetical protein
MATHRSRRCLMVEVATDTFDQDMIHLRSLAWILLLYDLRPAKMVAAIEASTCVAYRTGR